MMSDMLNELFINQNELMVKIKKDKPDFWEKEEPFEGYRKYMLASSIIAEAVEYQKELKWKWWKAKENYKVDDNNRKHSELPDIFHFFIQLCIEEGISAETLYHDYNTKQQLNLLRQDKRY